MELRVLILDDEQRISHELGEYLNRKGFRVKSASCPSDAFTLLTKEDFDIMILDVMLPEMDGISVLKKVKAQHPELEIIVISGHGDMDTVINALRNGAADYLKKPFRQADLIIAIERTTKFVSLQQKIKQLSSETSLISEALERDIDKTFIGKSVAIRDILDNAIGVASFPDTSVIISGESGTGKEIIARIIHFSSPRKQNRFIPVNCAAIPENLMESEFFGHKKGAFTGALSDKKGYLEYCDKGTLFLDEISDMPLNLQSKLLRALEEKRFMKLGCNTETSADVRFICATNKDLDALQVSGQFRSDLFYRFSTFKINIPPLRERIDDIEPLLHHYLDYFCRKNGLTIPAIEPGIVDRLKEYPFPGNVRELRNLVERALIINRTGKITLKDFPVFTKSHLNNHPEDLISSQVKQIKEAMLRTGNNQSKAAELLGISRYALIRKLKKYGISDSSF